tara:strand:- start:1331 stop:2251 length:921 start_codon:yes stop_codon:yes gene_type:complete
MKIAIIGRSELLFESMLYLRENGYEVVCILTANEAPEYKKTSLDFKKQADEWGIPFMQTSNIMLSFDFLKDSEADIGVSINYPSVIPEEVIRIFRLGILNAHGGDLPRYRGNACQAWAIINGEEKIGLCIHQMVGGELDSGDILAREFIEIKNTSKIAEIFTWMTGMVPKMFLKVINKLKEDPNFILERQSRNLNDALRCYPRNPEDGRIDWTRPREEIQRLINASGPPFEGAFCFLNEQKIHVYESEIYDDGEIYFAVPGQILKIEEKKITIATGNGKLMISDLYFDNNQIKMSDFFRSVRQRLN